MEDVGKAHDVDPLLKFGEYRHVHELFSQFANHPLGKQKKENKIFNDRSSTQSGSKFLKLEINGTCCFLLIIIYHT
jgi:hypothetical protein